jgi:ElaB/YqjD/DUF883 family membrane-anchored ribosome-binding protein
MADKSVETDFESLRADFTQMRGDLANLTKAITDMVRPGGKDWPFPTEADGENRVRRGLHKVVEEAETLGHCGASAVEHQIAERPLAVMAAAFGIGLLIGNLVHRR